MSEERRAMMAGRWYPGDPAELKQVVEGMLAANRPDYRGDVPRGLVVPHAGYIYSGEVAACSYNTVAGSQYDCVIVIAPSHREAFRGVSLYQGEAYHTPLGRVAVDRELLEELVQADQDDRLQLSRRGHQGEHSLELQLPFLQVALGEFKLAPLVMGDQSIATATALAEALATVCRQRNCLVVASTDLSHFHTQEEAELLDNRFIELFSADDPQELSRQLESGGTEACGGGPVISTMLYNRLHGGTLCKPLRYTTSARVTGDYDNVVGYFAGVVA